MPFAQCTGTPPVKNDTPPNILIIEINLSPPPQQHQQQQEQNIDQDDLELFCQATTVKKGSKRAIEQPETLAPRNVRRKLNL
ncbi:hypothetical protein TSAR_003551 [Trichomalopsis sarcophagae]|uniref:Uncharacterized protein n=1 Tax=Trichomalopsis sarcophagae TaxID=543379 RepID=A0A232F066_9HYME|nr:hypothetical protein TSAR_003551 [Trichomalopsis sarcophagae]